MFLLQDTHLLTHFSKGGNTLVEMFFFMCRRQLNPYSRLTLRHNGERKAYDINALVEQFGGKILCQLGIVEHHCANGRFGGFEVEAHSTHLVHKIFGVPMQFVLQGVGGGNHVEHSYAGIDDHRRN